MTPQEFIAKWGAPGGIAGPAYTLNEEQGAQSHFLDLCELLAVPKPGSSEGYLFEEKSAVIGGKTGYADVFKRGVFAWENKAPGRNLDAALKQLLTYSLALSNPPILVVSDRLLIRIHTQFTGHPSQTHSVALDELDQPDKLALLRRIWTAPESFKPKETSRDITEAAAKSFATLAEGLRRRTRSDVEPGAQLGQTPDPHTLRFLKSGPTSAQATPLDAVRDESVANRVAHFLTQCLFCFFAEDVGLLPGRMFERLVNNRHITPAKLTQGLSDLFNAMANGGMFGADDIAWFNGGLFKRVDVPELSILDVTELRKAANLNWSAIDVSIFGTLFERGLDPAKRSQLGAHYTDPATIDRIIDPVLRQPLLHKWELIAKTIQGLQAKSTQKKQAAYSAGGRHFKASPGDAAFQNAQALFYGWLDELKNFRILDPACGSGNFLFMGLKALKDIEHQSHLDASALGLDREADLVTGPHNVLGIELNGYAAELARVTVWIGELQWRMAHGYEFKRNPVLEPLEHIECRDALLTFVACESDCPELVEGRSAEPGARLGQMPAPHTLRFLKSGPTSAQPTPLDAAGLPAKHEAIEATWPKAHVVIGNPPFLGGSKKRRELGGDYFDALDRVFAGRVPGGADLVCYWFDKARVAMKSNGLEAAGLVSTNSIRGGSNRKVLDAIYQHSRIFEAWSDEGWVNDGAAVRVSLVCFGQSTETHLNGEQIGEILSDLTGTQSGGDVVDLAKATRLGTNAGAVFEGLRKDGPLDITGQLAREWLHMPNPHGKSNALVLFPLINGIDVTRRPRDGWVIDTGESLTEQDAALFEAPFTHIVQNVKPIRLQNNDRIRRTYWWRFGRNGEQLRSALKPLNRYINTPRVAKHRLFVWQAIPSIPDTATVAITRADDTTFGILHSRFHELWSLRMCTWLGVGNDPRYTPTTCFETFPFPAGLTPADTAHQRTETLPDGSVIPGNWCQSAISPQTLPASGQAKWDSDPKFPTAVHMQNTPVAPVEQAQGATNSEANDVGLRGANPTYADSNPIEFSGAALSQEPKAGVARMSGPISKSEALRGSASEPPPPLAPKQTGPDPIDDKIRNQALRNQAIAIAQAAKRLNDLREHWLNPPEWTHKVPEVTPLGLDKSPYPDRIEPKPGISEADLKALQKRTLTNLYNAKPAWLQMAHQQLDQAVAAAYDWADYTADMPDDEILKRLLALNLARASSGARTVAACVK